MLPLFFSDSVEEPHYLYMDGQNVYKFAVNAMSTDLKWVIEQAGLTQDDVDHVLPHQANIRIIETAMRKLKIPHDRYHINIQHSGNTSSACIPVLLDELNRAGSLHRGEIIAMSAFGGGLTTGAALLRW